MSYLVSDLNAEAGDAGVRARRNQYKGPNDLSSLLSQAVLFIESRVPDRTLKSFFSTSLSSSDN